MWIGVKLFNALRNSKQNRSFFLLVFVTISALHGRAEPTNSVPKEHQNLEKTGDPYPDDVKISDYYDKLWHHYHKHLNKIKSNVVEALAIHRDLGPEHDRTIQYRLIQEAFVGSTNVCKLEDKCQFMDAGCGNGSGMLYFSSLGWDVQGFTLAENQYEYITTKYPEFQVFLSSYSEIPDGIVYSGIYAIESLWYSDWRQTLKVWANHIDYHSRIVIIDDFAVNASSARNDPDIQGYVKGWSLRAITTVEEICAFAKNNARLQCIQRRNLTEEFKVNKYNYHWNKAPTLEQYWNHGNYFRHRSSINGLLIYELVSMEKF